MSLEKLDEIIRNMEETTQEFKRYKEIYNELKEIAQEEYDIKSFRIVRRRGGVQ